MTSEVSGTQKALSELLIAYADYLAANISLDAGRVARHLHEPWMYVMATRVVQGKTHADAEDFLKPGLAALKEAGYARTDFPRLNAQLLGEGLAMISGEGVRYKTDGTQLAALGMTYLWRQVAGQWKLAVVTMHERSGVLPLEQVALPGSAA